MILPEVPQTGAKWSQTASSLRWVRFWGFPWSVLFFFFGGAGVPTEPSTSSAHEMSLFAREEVPLLTIPSYETLLIMMFTGNKTCIQGVGVAALPGDLSFSGRPASRKFSKNYS